MKELPNNQNWDLLYKADDANWQDLHRARILILYPYLILLIVATCFVFLLNQQIEFFEFELLWVGKNFLLFFGTVTILAILFQICIFNLIARSSKLFVKRLFDNDKNININELIRLRVLGVPPLPPPLNSVFHYPYIFLTGEELVKRYKWTRWLGGPAKLIVHDGWAIYLERGNRFSRVVGSSIAFLNRNEKIKEIVDLRPRIQNIVLKNAWTNDGIKVNMNIRLEFQILPTLEENYGEITAKRNIIIDNNLKRIHPYNREAVQAAVEHAAVRQNEQNELIEYNWFDGVCHNVEGQIREYLSNHSLGELFIADKSTDGKVSIMQLMSAEVKKWLRSKINNDIQSFGAFLVDLQITKIELPDILKQQRTKSWETAWKRQIAINSEAAKAKSIHDFGEARTQVKFQFINKIISNLKGEDFSFQKKYLLLSLSTILEDALENPMCRAYFTKEIIEVLEDIQGYVQSSDTSTSDKLSRAKMPSAQIESITNPHKNLSGIKPVPSLSKTPSEHERFEILVALVGGDREIARRLVKSEMINAPKASRSEWIDHAIQNLEFDNRDLKYL